MRNKFFLTTVVLFFAALYSCKDSEGFKKHSTGLDYKFITQTKGDSLLKPGDVAEMTLKYFSPDDSLMFDSKEIPGKFRIKISEKNSHFGGSLEDALKMMKVGDSAQFLISADSFYTKVRRQPLPSNLKQGDKLRFDIKIIGKTTEEAIMKEREKFVAEQKANEKKLIQEYLQKNNITVEPTKSGLYIVSLEKGNGAQINAGETAVVHYTGTLLNGQKFDSSLDTNQPFTFTLGQKRVIAAWDEAVATMKIGDKIKIIAPSELAYGQRGAGSVIPPYTPLVFEIKLLDIKK